MHRPAHPRIHRAFISIIVLLATSARAGAEAGPLVSGPFTGTEVNGGTVTLRPAGDRHQLTLSGDFVVPSKAPAPHWQIVDAEGNAYLLQRLVTKGDVLHRTITLPAHVRSIDKVRIWCAWAEVVLGETAFDHVIDLAAPDPAGTQPSSPFVGAKANTGYAVHRHRDGACELMLSDDFRVPDAPAPHWQIVDSCGRVYLLQRLDIKDGRFNRTIAVPGYVPDIARVQIWCAWAESLLGEATFATPVR